MTSRSPHANHSSHDLRTNPEAGWKRHITTGTNIPQKPDGREPPLQPQTPHQNGKKRRQPCRSPHQHVKPNIRHQLHQTRQRPNLSIMGSLQHHPSHWYPDPLTSLQQRDYPRINRSRHKHPRTFSGFWKKTKIL